MNDLWERLKNDIPYAIVISVVFAIIYILLAFLTGITEMKYYYIFTVFISAAFGLFGIDKIIRHIRKK